MKIFLFFLILVLQLEFAASRTTFVLKLSNGVDSTSLKAGVDEAATDGVDFALGEINAPRIPPPGVVFHAAFIIYDSVYLKEPVWSYVDYRPIQNKRHYQIDYIIDVKRGGSYDLTFRWNYPLPNFIDSAKITDTIVDFNLVNINLNNSGSGVVTNRYINDFFLKVWYNNPNAEGIDDSENNEDSFKIFPNPAESGLFFNTTLGSIDYKIYSLLGEEKLAGSSMPGTERIDVGFLPAGIYNIVIFKHGMTVSERTFIKQ